MLKLGIYDVENLQELRPDPRKRVSIALYESLNGLPDPLRSQLQERVLWRLTTSTGVNKRTYNHRFPEFDRALIDLIKNAYKDRSTISIHDVGVSDGRTSLELYYKLKQAFSATVRFLASDTHQTFTSVNRNRSRLTVILDKKDNTVQIVFPPFVFDTIKKDQLLYYPLNRLILFWLLRGRVKTLLTDYHSGAADLQIKTIDVIDPQCVFISKTDTNFGFSNYNVLEPMDKQFDVIRAMNILNRDYFSSLQIVTATRNCCAALRDGGLFITGSNDGPGSLVDGSVFKKQRNSFVEIVKSGRGALIRQIVLRSDVL